MTKEKRTTKEVFGDIAIDSGKLVFGGIILAGIFSSDINKAVLISVGFAVWLSFLGIGVYLTTKK